jgi:folate-binding protein YgfZ
MLMPESNPIKISTAELSRKLREPDQLSALLHDVGMSPITEIGWIRVSGNDRVRWLNGMVTNAVQQMAPGAGCYNFILSAQGRIQGDAYAFAEPEQILLRTSRSQVETLLALLDRFIIMDEVELTPIATEWTGLQIAGPQSAALLEKIGIPIQSVVPGIERVSWQSGEVTVTRVHAPLVPRLELWADAAVLDRLTQALLSAGAVSVDRESMEQLRLLEGTPRFGIDIRDRELPQETGQKIALHFTKGCYLGQEIVERIHSRGNVHRILSGFRLEGDMPSSDLILHSEGKPAGELTSFSDIRLPDHAGGNVRLALGYIRREIMEKGSPLNYIGGTATPITLPYAPAQQTASKLSKEEHHV